MEFQFEKEVAQNHLNNSGWSLDDFNHVNIHDCHVFYILDYKSQETRLLAIMKDAFEKHKINTSFSLGECVHLIQTLMKSFLKGKLEGNKSEAFASLLVNYIKQTQTYHALLKQTPDFHRLHVILNVYPLSKHDGRIAPLIIHSNEMITDVKEVLAISKQHAFSQFSRNPDWFSGIGDPSRCFITKQ